MDLLNHLIEQKYPDIIVKNDFSYLKEKSKFLVHFEHEGNNHMEIFPSCSKINLNNFETSKYEQGIIFSKRKKTSVAFCIRDYSTESNIEITNLYQLHNKRTRSIIVDYVIDTDKILIDYQNCEITDSIEELNKSFLQENIDNFTKEINEETKIKIFNIFSKYLNKSIFESNNIKTIKDINDILISHIKGTSDIVYINNLMYCRMKLYDELK